jgi:type VI secretion system secreted protein Hcp
MAIDAFLQFTDPGSAVKIEGETQDAYFKKPKEGGGVPCFELQNWSFGTANDASISSASMGAGSGKAKFDAFSVTKAIDTATPFLFHTLCTGGHYPLLTLWIRKAGTDPENRAAGMWYLEWQFAMAFVQEITWSHNDPAPTEDVKFVYGAVQFQYKQQQSKGQLGAAKTQRWSQVLNAEPGKWPPADAELVDNPDSIR